MSLWVLELAPAKFHFWGVGPTIISVEYLIFFLFVDVSNLKVGKLLLVWNLEMIHDGDIYFSFFSFYIKWVV